MWLEGKDASEFVPSAVIKSGCARYGRMRKSKKFASKILKIPSLIKKWRIIAIITAIKTFLPFVLSKIKAIRRRAVQRIIRKR